MMEKPMNDINESYLISLIFCSELQEANKYKIKASIRLQN